MMMLSNVLFVAVAPTRPSAPVISCVDSDSVELVWESSESFKQRSSIVKFFTVQHCVAECDVWTSCAVVADTHCRIQHLTPGQMYSFRIIAHGEGSTRSEPSVASESLIIPPCSPSTPKTPTTTSMPSVSFTNADSVSLCSMESNSHNNSSNSSGGDASKDTDFYTKYVELEDIDRGRFSVVRKCQEVSTGQELAVKFVHRKRWKKQLIVKEYQILSAISHANVVKASAFCETSSYSAIVMEL